MLTKIRFTVSGKQVGFRAKAVALAVAGTLALGGCASSVGSPGEALQVGDVTYSENDLTAFVDDYSLLAGEMIPRSVAAQELVATTVFSQSAGEELVSMDETRALLEELVLPSVPEQVDVDDLSDVTLEYFQGLWTLEAVTEQAGEQAAFEAFQERLANTDVTLNPRYGEIVDGSYLPPGLLGDQLEPVEDFDENMIIEEAF